MAKSLNEASPIVNVGTVEALADDGRVKTGYLNEIDARNAGTGLPVSVVFRSTKSRGAATQYDRRYVSPDFGMTQFMAAIGSRHRDEITYNVDEQGRLAGASLVRIKAKKR